ncbi:hypothetical protein RI054_03g19620 [Pseudoscourfieldia marina]
MKGGKRKAQQEENRTPKPKISPHAALATCRRRGAKTLTKNATALATNEGLPQLKRPQHVGRDVQIETLMGNFRGELYEAQDRAQFARRITSANRPQAVITCTTISRNLPSLVRSRPTAGRLARRLELYDNRGNTYPIKIVDNFFASRWHRHSTST